MDEAAPEPSCTPGPLPARRLRNGLGGNLYKGQARPYQFFKRPRILKELILSLGMGQDKTHPRRRQLTHSRPQIDEKAVAASPPGRYLPAIRHAPTTALAPRVHLSGWAVTSAQGKTVRHGGLAQPFR